MAGIDHHNYENIPLQEKAAWLINAPGGASDPLPPMLKSIANSFYGSSERLDANIAALGAAWEGEAAETAQGSMRRSVERTIAAQEANDRGHVSVTDYGVSFEEMRRKVHYEDPNVGWQPAPAAGAPVPGDPFVVQDDQFAAMERHRTADAAANAALRAHEQRTRELVEQFPDLDAVIPAAATGGAAEPAVSTPQSGGVGAGAGGGAGQVGAPSAGGGAGGQTGVVAPSGGGGAGVSGGGAAGVATGPSGTAPSAPVAPGVAGGPSGSTGNGVATGPGGIAGAAPGGVVAGAGTGNAATGGRTARAPGAGVGAASGGGRGGAPVVGAPTGSGGFTGGTRGGPVFGTAPTPGSFGAGAPGGGSFGGAGASGAGSGVLGSARSPGLFGPGAVGDGRQFGSQLPVVAEPAPARPGAGQPGPVAAGAGANTARPGMSMMPPMMGGGAGAGGGGSTRRMKYWVPTTEVFDVELPPHVDGVIGAEPEDRR